MEEISDSVKLAQRIAREVDFVGGVTYYVGGYVRDHLMNISNKDVDIEIHGITPAALEKILDSVGERITIGESFGIYGVKGVDLDIAMPRLETNRGNGHRDFDVCVDPFVGTYGASKRRDFTINAMMENVLTGEIIDHFGGQEDIKKKVIRHVNDITFEEDPLRVLRAAQFASRFEFEIAPETIKLCSKMELKELSSERVFAELGKALLKAARPSSFFQTLRAMNQLDYWFPEAQALIGVPQNQKYHGEGDVWNHTMMVIDECAKLRHKASDKEAFMLTGLVHDFGKAVCTEQKDGIYHAYAHEFEGLPLVKSFIKRLTSERNLLAYVLNMTRLHMKPNTLSGLGVKIKTTNKMFDDSICPEDLILVAIADDRGRINTTLSQEEFDSIRSTTDKFLYERLVIYKEYMNRPYVMGRDLIEAGLKPGEKFKEYLNYAHKLRLAGVDKKEALNQTLSYARKMG